MGPFSKTIHLVVGLLLQSVMSSFAKNDEEGVKYIPVTRKTDYRYIDRLIGESMFYICNLGEKAFLKFESYSYPTVRKELSDTTSSKVSTIRTFDVFLFKISNLQQDDSGLYACALHNASSKDVTKLAVHDPMKFLWTFSDRGMSPTRYIELGGTRANLKWSPWASCDGCAGHGERRRFGFCYTKSKTTLRQCLDYRKLRLHMRYVAKNKKNEILVETCYNECDSDEDMFKPLSKLSLLMQNGDSLEIACPGNITTRTAIRWERQYYTMLRKDVSFGYGPTLPYYITRSNKLLVNRINFGGAKKIVLTCVVWRQERHDFELTLLPETGGVTNTIEHLRVMSISCIIQLALFLVIILVLDVMKAFAETVSLNAK